MYIALLHGNILTVSSASNYTDFYFFTRNVTDNNADCGKLH